MNDVPVDAVGTRIAEPNVIRLETDVVPTEPAPTAPASGLHAFAISGMAISALLGIVALFVSTAISWPDESLKYPRAFLVLAGVGFLVFCFLAVYSAIRDTQARARATAERTERGL